MELPNIPDKWRLRGPKRSLSTYDAEVARIANHPINVLWQAPAMMWSVLAGLCVALVLSMSPGFEGNRIVVFGLASFLILWVILLTLGTLYALRSAITNLSPYQVVGLGLLVMLLWTWGILVFAGVLVAPWLFGNEVSDWRDLMVRSTGVALAVGALGLAAFHNHWRARQAAVRAKQAELEALQARIHPHFLFNSLNTALALVHQRPDDAERVLLDLSDLFRSALAGPRYIPLSEELELAKRYLEIEQLRLGERLEVEWDLPATMPALEVPALSVQPLVENAVRHGIERRPQGGRIEVVLVRGADRAQLTVRNDLPAQAPPAGGNGHGVGQPSVASRIEAMTGGRGSLVTSLEGGRYVATLSLPLEA